MRPRKFDTWTYKKNGIERSISIRASGTVPDIIFHAEDKEANIRIQSTDLKEVTDKLAERYDALAEVALEPWVAIVITNNGSEEGHYSRAPSLLWVPYGKGTNGLGEPCWSAIDLEYDGSHFDLLLPTDHPDRKDGAIRSKPATWSGKWRQGGHPIEMGEPTLESVVFRHTRFGNGSGSKTCFERGLPQHSTLPATVETVNALLAFEWELRNIAFRMKESFAQENVEATLARLGQGMKMLGAGE